MICPITTVVIKKPFAIIRLLHIESSGGTMAFDKDVRIGFLRQDIDFVEGRTILDEAYQAFEEIKQLETHSSSDTTPEVKVLKAKKLHLKEEIFEILKKHEMA